MDLLKNLVFFGALAIVAGGVYVLLTNNPQTKPPPGVDENWSVQSNQLKVELPGTPTTRPTLPGVAPQAGPSAVGTAGQQPSQPLPTTDTGGPYAPPFRPTPPPAAIQSGTEAPRFTPAPPAPAEQSGAAAIPFTPSPSGGGQAGGEAPRSMPAAVPGDVSNLPANHTEPLPANSATLPLGTEASRAGLSADRPTPGGTPSVRPEFAAFIDAAVKKIEEGGIAEAHESLSAFYANPRLTPEEDRQLTELLDQVAGTVVYSRQHLLEPPYVVQPGESLAQIAEKYEVPWQLLAKINGIRDPERLSPGQQLKVVRGPFDATIRLGRYELTLMLHGRYAGRFPIGIGRDQPVLEGSYVVKDKMVNPTYYGPNQVIDANDPNNPLGERLIGLGNRLSIHGTNDPQNIGRTGGPGTIALSARDVDDVYDILSIGSRVVIQR